MNESSVMICVCEDRSSEGQVIRRDFSGSERILRALKVGGILFGAAVLTVFVPVLHFVLVPLFLILSLVFGITTWLAKGEVISGEVNCPSCGAKNVLRKAPESWPKQERCSGCSLLLQFDLKK